MSRGQAKSKAITRKDIDQIVSTWRFTPKDHEFLQVIDNTIPAEHILSMARVKMHELIAAKKTGCSGDTVSHIRDLARLLIIAEHKLVGEEIDKQSDVLRRAASTGQE